LSRRNQDQFTTLSDIDRDIIFVLYVKNMNIYGSYLIMEGGEWMNRKSQIRLFIILGLVLSWIFVSILPANDVPRMTKEELKGMLGNPEVTLIDVRANADWTGSNLKIKGAVREDPRKLNTWEDKYPKDKTLVFYCA